MSDDRAALAAIAEHLRRSECTVAFTGAGISTESGIADYRGTGGVWTRHQPVYFDEFLRSREARARYWAQKLEAWTSFAGARPNVAHEVFAKLERRGDLEAIVTQNIDGLHQDAGSEHVLELHGTSRFIYCLDCETRYDPDEIFRRMREDDVDVPKCDACDGLLKPGTVSFGQDLPEDVLAAAQKLSVRSELYLAVGSSLVVYPAAALPRIASEAGAALAIINRDETPLDSIADWVIRTPIGEAFSAIWEHYEGAMS